MIENAGRVERRTLDFRRRKLARMGTHKEACHTVQIRITTVVTVIDLSIHLACAILYRSDSGRRRRGAEMESRDAVHRYARNAIAANVLKTLAIRREMFHADSLVRLRVLEELRDDEVVVSVSCESWLEAPSMVFLFLGSWQKSFVTKYI